MLVSERNRQEHFQPKINTSPGKQAFLLTTSLPVSSLKPHEEYIFNLERSQFFTSSPCLVPTRAIPSNHCPSLGAVFESQELHRMGERWGTGTDLLAVPHGLRVSVAFMSDAGAAEES